MNVNAIYRIKTKKGGGYNENTESRNERRLRGREMQYDEMDRDNCEGGRV